MKDFLDTILHHLIAAGFGSGVLVIALITCWPEVIPKTAQDWWCWARETLQTIVPVKRLPPKNTMKATPEDVKHDQ